MQLEIQLGTLIVLTSIVEGGGVLHGGNNLIVSFNRMKFLVLCFDVPNLPCFFQENTSKVSFSTTIENIYSVDVMKNF